MDKLVFINSNSLNEDPYTTSKIISQYGGQKHKNVRELIEIHIEKMKQLGRVTFETIPLKTNNGIYPFQTDKTNIPKRGRPEKVYKLNEQQASFLITLMKNTEQVVNFKFELVKQFYVMREELIKRRIIRVDGKKERNVLTEAIDKLPNSPHKKFLYSHCTNLIYKKLFGKDARQLQQQFGITKQDNLRDYLTAKELSTVKELEDDVAHSINLGFSYKEIKLKIQQNNSTKMK